MPRKTTQKDGREELPRTLKQSDKHAQEIWIAAHDSAVETYGEGEAAHRIAFAAVKHQYQKEGDTWVAKDEKGPSDPQAKRGPTTRHRPTDPDPAPTAGRWPRPTPRRGPRQRSHTASPRKRDVIAPSV